VQEWLPLHDAPETAENAGLIALIKVPVLYRGPYDPTTIEAFAEGRSTVPGADHIREGCVVQPVKERTDLHLGRVKLKIVGNGYLEKS